MFLLRGKSKGKSINHPLGKLEEIPKKIEDDRLIELIDRLRNGDRSVITEIVMGHVRYGISIASRYAMGNNFLSHDLVSEAMETILLACEDIYNNKEGITNFTGYLKAKLHSRLCTTVIEEGTVRKPRRTVTDHLKKNINKPVKTISMSEYEVNLVVNPNRMIEVRECLEKAIHNERERQIISLREQSFKDCEIAEIMDLSATTIGKIRQEVEIRFNDLQRR